LCASVPLWFIPAARIPHQRSISAHQQSGSVFLCASVPLWFKPAASTPHQRPSAVRLEKTDGSFPRSTTERVQAL
ncbi:MAG: hypothetical protein ACOYOZ_13640, partial [Pirellula sp.]